MKTKNLYALNSPLIRAYRRKKKISQKDFGGLLGGLSQQTVASWERGLSFPDQKNLLKIAKVLGVETKALYLVDPKLAPTISGGSGDLVLFLLSFRNRIRERETLSEIELTDLEIMRILINDCDALINERFSELQKGCDINC